MFNFWKRLTYENIKNSYDKGKIERQKDIEYFVKTNLKSVLKEISKNAKKGINEIYYGIETRIGLDDMNTLNEIRNRVADALKEMGFSAIYNIHVSGGLIIKINKGVN